MTRGIEAGRQSGPGMVLLLLLEPRGAILGAETSHYTAAGISGLNSSADWEPVDCIFYRIPIEKKLLKTGRNKQGVRSEFNEIRWMFLVELNLLRSKYLTLAFGTRTLR